MSAAPRAPDDFVPLIVFEGNVELRRPDLVRREPLYPVGFQRPEYRLLEILIVENDKEISAVLRSIIEVDGLYRVTDVATDLAETMAAIEAHRPGLALIDLNLGGNATGIEVAANVLGAGIPALFSTGNPLPFPVPELALGCLCKPYTCYSVSQSLRIAEQLIRGNPVDLTIPLELELY